ncbi:hypothetical protein [Streptomyces sp. NPDC005423]|uniref:hypothetical protein n=1 Tax=Streptomyces sp. NPDC005423 TaxID=3155343 RepID=UPI00339E0F78
MSRSSNLNWAPVQSSSRSACRTASVSGTSDTLRRRPDGSWAYPLLRTWPTAT